MTALHKFVINLPSRRDRRAEMERQLGRAGWEATFVAATRPDHAADFPSIGARGCFLSHLDLLRRGRALGGHVVLMEDDLDFHRDFARLWQPAFDALPPDWSIFYPAHHDAKTAPGIAAVMPSTAIVGAHLVVFHRDVVGRIVDGLETILSRPAGHPQGGPMHVDGAYSTIRKQNPDLATYAFAPALGFQRPSLSDIAESNSFDHIKVLRPAVKVLRKLKARISRLRS